MDQQNNGFTVHEIEAARNNGELTAFAKQIAEETKPAPIWYNQATGQPNIPQLAACVIDEYGLKKRGSRVIDSNGKIVSRDTLNRYVLQEATGTVKTAIRKVVSDVVALIPMKAPVVDIYKLNTITAADLKSKAVPPPSFIVKSLLPCGLCVLAAPPKTGKSWLCLALADAIASGERFLGFDTNPGKVLYMALEDSESRIQERLNKIGSNMPKNLHLAFRGVARLDDGLCEQITHFIDDNPDARCVIIDTIGRVKTGSSMGMNAYEADTQQYSILQELALSRNVAIVCVTHFSKLKQFSSTDDPFERITGSMGLFGVSDAAWLIFGKRGADEMTFRITGRDALDNEYIMKFDADTAKWRRLGSSEEVEQQKELDEYRADPLVKTIRRLVSESVDHAWTNSIEELRKRCIEYEHAIPADSIKALAHKVDIRAKMLLEEDGIMFTRGTGGRSGRKYTFRDVNHKTLLD